MRNMFCIFGVGCLLAISAKAEAGTVIHVDADATGPAHDGASWCTAYLDLQQALDVATAGTTIRVGNGTYRPSKRTDLADPRSATFQLINGVTIEGGYAGCGAPDPDERDFVGYETILSGDLAGNDEPRPPDGASDCCTAHSGEGCDDADCEATVCAQRPECCSASSWDYSCAEFAIRICCATCPPAINVCENAYHVARGAATDLSTVLEGLTIESGNAIGLGVYYGGGILGENASPLLRSCTFRRNYAEFAGGAVYELGGTFIHCTFLENQAERQGAAVFVAQMTPTFIDCVFLRNSSSGRTFSGGGSALHDRSPGCRVERCRFHGNVNAGHNNPGALFLGGGAVVTDSVFTGNLGLTAGAVETSLLPGFSNAQITNCSFSGNKARLNRGGGGLFAVSSLERPVTPHVSNCVFWGNEAYEGDRRDISLNLGATINISHSLTQNIVWPGVGNISEDPLFVRLPSDGGDGWGAGNNDDFGDLRLLPGSPCIDAGSNAAVPSDVTTDLDGNPRFVDDPLTSDCPQPGAACGTPPIVDMGAYEFQGEAIRVAGHAQEGPFAFSSGDFMQAARNALLNPSNFGLGGLVRNSIAILPDINSPITEESLDGIDVFIGSAVSGYDAAEAEAILHFVINGGVLIFYGDVGLNYGPQANSVSERFGVTFSEDDFLIEPSISIEELGHAIILGPFGTSDVVPNHTGSIVSARNARVIMTIADGPSAGRGFLAVQDLSTGFAGLGKAVWYSDVNILASNFELFDDNEVLFLNTIAYATGACVDDSSCGDGNGCTQDLCSANRCVNSPARAGTPCGDPSDTPCDNPDTCDGSGSCEINNEPTGTSCNDGNDCTANDTCAGGACVEWDYPWTGFFQPVDNAPTYNRVKAGSAIPLKFSLGCNQGLAILESGYPKSSPVACTGALVVDEIESTVTAGGSNLSYDPVANQYIYVWKTDKAWASTCRVLNVKLADRTSHYAYFTFFR